MIRASPHLSPLRLSTSAPPPSPLSDGASTTFSLESHDSGESLEEVLGDLKEQMSSIATATNSVRFQMKHLFRRAKMETIAWMEHPLTPRTPALEAWLAAKKLSATPNLNEFLDTVYASAVSLDLESRVITLSKVDAVILTKGQQRITVYELVAMLPTLFQ